MIEWLAAVGLGAVAIGITVDHWRQVTQMRAWGAAHGLPVMPPVSRMRLAQAFEALQPTMGGSWNGLWVRLWTRPVWTASPRGVANGSKISIRVTAERDLVRGSASAPDYFNSFNVNGRELWVSTKGGVRLEEIPHYLTDAVAYAKALTPAEALQDARGAG